MKQRVLVHGAENFVGRRLMAALAESDWAESLPVASLDTAALRQAAATADAVAHCVVGNPSSIVRGATAVYRALPARTPMQRVVHLSSMTVYGTAHGMVDERSPSLPDLGAYSRAQRDAEHIAAGYSNTVILRPGVEYGPDCPQWTLRIARLLFARRLGDLGAAGDGYCNLLYIDDLIGAILRSLRLPDIGGTIFNLAADAPPTWNEYFIAFGRALGAVPIRRVTQRRLRVETRFFAPLLKGFELIARRVPGIAGPFPPISPSLLALCGHDIRLDVRRAEQVLDIEWTDTRLGMERAAIWSRVALRRS